MLREEGAHIGPERPAIGFDDRRREAVEVIGIEGLHPLERARVDDHEDDGAWSDLGV